MLNVFEFHKHQILIFDISCFCFPLIELMLVIVWVLCLGMLSSGPERKRKKMKYHCFKNIPHCHWWKFRKGWKGWCSFKPQLAPWKGESLRRAPHAVILRTACRPASFFWASGELNLTETSSPPRFFREGFVQASTEVRRPFHLDAWDQAPGVQRMLSSGQLELAELKDLIGSFQTTLTFLDWNCKMSSLFLFSCGCHWM